MHQQYEVKGMSCNGCRGKVEKTLNSIPGIQAKVELNPPFAELTTEKDHIDLEEINKELSKVGEYSLHPTEKNKMEHSHCCSDTTTISEPKPIAAKGSLYYCPMQCEGEKTYPHPGSCPVCGMDLVPMQTMEGKEENAGYISLRNKFIIAVIFTLPVFFLSMGGMIPALNIHLVISPDLSNWIQFVLCLPIVFYATWDYFKRAWVSFATWKLNMFSLIGLGAGAAFVFSIVALLFPEILPMDFKTSEGHVHVYFESVAVILTLVLLGQLLEAKAHHKTGNAIRKLINLVPETAFVIVNGKEVETPVKEVKMLDVVRIKPGGKIPVDGVVMEGSSTVDESMITGESIPVRKEEKDKLIGGTINGDQVLLMKVEKVGNDTLLAQIITLVNEASRSRAPIQKLVDKIAAFFVPVVILIAVLTFLIWAFTSNTDPLMYGLINALSVLIVACPCALGLATPMSIMVGVGKSAQHGVLIKKAAALELMNKAEVLLLDKTGTITEGKPSFEHLEIMQNHFDKVEVLSWIAAINMQSQHPIAQAIVQEATKQNLDLPQISDFVNYNGKGISATIVSKGEIALGNAALMKLKNIDIQNIQNEKAEQFQSEGKTVSFISLNKELIGFVVIGDKIKSDALEAIQYFQSQGKEVIMLTGDHKNTAQSIANKVGIRQFYASLQPQDKLSFIKNLQEKGKIVAMAGDGINDAPALAQAEVSIAMSNGTDIAMDTATVTLIKGSLSGLVKLEKISKGVLKNIKQNLWLAFVYNIIGIPIAAGILYPGFNILMSPMLAALAMSLSSVSVIVNALRLNKLKL